MMLRFTMNCDMFTKRPQTIASRKKGWHILHVQFMCEEAITRAAMMSKLDAHKTSNTANKFAKEPIPQNKTQCTKKYNNICRNSNRKKIHIHRHAKLLSTEKGQMGGVHEF